MRAYGVWCMRKEKRTRFQWINNFLKRNQHSIRLRSLSHSGLGFRFLLFHSFHSFLHAMAKRATTHKSMPICFFTFRGYAVCLAIRMTQCSAVIFIFHSKLMEQPRKWLFSCVLDKLNCSEGMDALSVR